MQNSCYSSKISGCHRLRGANDFLVVELCVFPTKGEHLLTLGVAMQISKVVECRIVQNLSHSSCEVHMHLCWTGLFSLG